MINLVQQDLLVRLQKSQCCLGELTNRLVNKIKIGASDVDCKLQELQVMQGMLEYLKCYRVLCDEEDADVLSTGTLRIDSVTIGAVIDVTIAGTSIGSITATTTNVNTEMIALTAAINILSPTSEVSAIFVTGNPGIINLTGPCSNPGFATSVSGDAELTGVQFSGGVCGCGDEVTTSDNCLTEEQVQAMFSYIQRKCKICWQLPDSDYE